jgi:ABC-type uncharacterized transport system permease subunit
MNGRRFVENKTDQFKGFNQSQKQSILDMQERQREEQRQKLKSQEEHENKWALNEMANRRTVELLERQKQRDARLLCLQIQKENQVKSVEDKKRYFWLIRQYYYDKVLYTNPPKEDFFNQFNTTSR